MATLTLKLNRFGSIEDWPIDDDNPKDVDLVRAILKAVRAFIRGEPVNQEIFLGCPMKKTKPSVRSRVVFIYIPEICRPRGPSYKYPVSKSQRVPLKEACKRFLRGKDAEAMVGSDFIPVSSKLTTMRVTTLG
jgi:hypothetical protein